MSPAESREPGMRWYVRHSMKLPCSAIADNAVLKTQTLGDGRRQAARFKAGEGRLGSQDRSNPAPHVDRRHNLPVARNEADRSAGLIKEEYETQAGRTEAPTARSPVAGTVDAVKPLHAQWPSSDEPRVSR